MIKAGDRVYHMAVPHKFGVVIHDGLPGIRTSYAMVRWDDENYPNSAHPITMLVKIPEPPDYAEYYEAVTSVE